MAGENGVVGEITLRGPSVMKGYHRDPEATAGVLAAGGWLRTGDLGWRDADGFFFITGRAKEIIIKGGENIAPREIDEALLSHPAVAEAAAVGIRDAHLGEDIAACVVLKHGQSCSAHELMNWCELKIGRLKTPSRIVFPTELPYGPTGKVLRHAIVKLLQRAPQDRDPGTATAFAHAEALVLEAWRDCLRCDIQPDDNFFALGGHSLAAMAVLARLRRSAGVSLPLGFMFEHPTVAAQAAAIITLAEGRDALVVPPRDRSARCPLSPAQERIWFLDQLHPGLAVYNESQAMRLEGPLRLDLVERALEAVMRRHEAAAHFLPGG